MFGTSFRAACGHAAKARSVNQALCRSVNGTLSTVGTSDLDRFPTPAIETLSAWGAELTMAAATHLSPRVCDAVSIALQGHGVGFETTGIDHRGTTGRKRLWRLHSRANAREGATAIPQVVEQATSAAKLSSSPNPSVQGELVTFTAKVTSPTTAPVVCDAPVPQA